jgi:L-fuconolactonase
MEPWKRQMEQIAQYPNIYCKLSGMVTEADQMNWKKEDFVAYVHHIVQVFGKNRVMFGSDWPVCLLAASYDQVYELLKDILPGRLTEEEEAKIFGVNAFEFYKLKPTNMQLWSDCSEI